MTAIKRKEKKSLFYLIAIAIMVAIMGISCSGSPTDPANLSEDGGGTGTGSGGSGASTSGYNVDVVYQEVKDALINQGIDVTKAQESQLDTIWKALANGLYVTSANAYSDANGLKNGVYFYFDQNGNMLYGNPNAAPQDKNKIVKVFQKAVLVKVNGGYTIGGLYKVGNLNFAGVPSQGVKTMIQDNRIGITLNEGDYEIVFVNTQSSHNGGYAYALYGSSSSTKNEDFSQVVKPEDYTGRLQLYNGIGKFGGYYRYARFYR